MIYLIGGTVRTGKTTVAKRLSKKLNCSWMAIDYLVALVQETMSPQELKQKFPGRYALHKLKNNHELYHKKYRHAQRMKFHKVQTESLWAGLKTMISFAYYDDRDLILEGYHLDPKKVSQLLKTKFGKKIKALFLYRLDEQAILEAVQKSKDPNDWLLKNAKKMNVLANTAKDISLAGAQIKQQANKYNLSSLNMDGDFNKNVNRAVRFFIKG